MAEPVPVTKLSPGPPDTDGDRSSTARDDLAGAELYWLSTVRPDGRPHVTPLLGVGGLAQGALYFCTGPNERKAKNLSSNCHCVLTTARPSTV